DDGRGWRSPQSQGAPVAEDGTPVYHSLPEMFETARTDGERWRWLLAQAATCGSQGKAKSDLALATFLHGQFGVQTMRRMARPFAGGRVLDQDSSNGKTGIFAVQTLGENETIAKLATGVKRFPLPKEFAYIAQLRALGKSPVKEVAKRALELVATVFENRRQYTKALPLWQAYRSFNKDLADDHIRQISGNWGTFDPVMSQPAGKNPTVDFRFRNGKRASFTAHRVDLRKLLDDVKRYIESRPAKLDPQQINLGLIGYRLVRQEEKKYIREKAAEWTLPLTPRDGHFDRRISLDIPLEKAGVYLLVGKMEKGNTSRILVWLDDAAIAKKDLGKETLYFVADARTGAPLPKANVEFLGWRQEWVRKTKQYKVQTTRFAEYTDNDGLIILPEKRLTKHWQWIAIATTPEGRLAYHGFHKIWYSRHRDTPYQREKGLIITDRPVYRPGDTVHIKAWVRRATYDLDDVSMFAGKEFPIEIRDARGNKILEKSFKADEFGGFELELPLLEEAGLGTYRVTITRHGTGTFRVEEYKKPEYEVSVDAPSVPVMLGDTVKATVKAKYYFGTPVTDATVKLKVLRYAHSERWYPPMPWDWFYGAGYSWFAPDYEWYPGWRVWGCPRPGPWWSPRRGLPPEVVMEQETAIGKDGTVAVNIDTTMAKEIHGDLDHRYEVTAEVRDRSRRTIVGTGKVLVARKPFDIRVWVDRGYYRTGDRVQAQLKAFTLDRKPVAAKGTLKLLRVTYSAGRIPEETEVQSWPVTTDADGMSQVLLVPKQPGQYRIAVQLRDAAGHQIKGGYLFVVRGPDLDEDSVRFNELELLADKAEYAPGDSAQLMVNTRKPDATVLLFARPVNGVYARPKVLRMSAKSRVETVAITRVDMPNIFMEGLTISDGRVYSETRELVVPPKKRILNVDVTPSAPRFRPGSKGNVRIRLTDIDGKPFSGTAALTIYDKSVEYISGGGNVPEIREFFWKWRRPHRPRTESSIPRILHSLLKHGEQGMRSLGAFGHMIADEDGNRGSWAALEGALPGNGGGRPRGGRGLSVRVAKAASFGAVANDGGGMGGGAQMAMAMAAAPASGAGGRGADGLVTPTVRSDFADTALWVGTLETNTNGEATIPVSFPDSLTTWVVKTWAVGHGTRVGQGRAEVITAK
ncbi:MAG: alpha-2-macroglobulin, partial [Lentisphaerae bacterium]|nr:alpha-2-macroglobulin [Lentisphaerota bacterium]